MELHHGRSGGGEEKVLPWKIVCMAQLPGQRAQPSSARAQGALGHLSAIGLGFGDAVYGQGLGSVIPVGPFQPGLFSISLFFTALHGRGKQHPFLPPSTKVVTSSQKATTSVKPAFFVNPC